MSIDLTNTPILSRRLFLRRGLASVSGFYLLPMVQPLNVQAEEKVKLRGEADSCIFIFLVGGASHLDTFDIKEGRWTPPKYDIRTIKPGLVLPYGLFPRLSDQVDRIAFVRCIEAWESAHNRAQYYLQAGHPPSPARQKEIPSIGAVIAYEFHQKRKPADFLPPFVAMNYGGGLLIREGCLPDYAVPLALDLKGDVPLIIPDDEKTAFQRRWGSLQEIEKAATGGGSSGQLSRQYESFAQSAFRLMSSPRLSEMLKLQEDDRKRYGSSALGDACILAHRMLEADAGTRYISIAHNNWDLHTNMFDANAKVNHYTLCSELDNAVSSLVADLAKTKRADGKTLLEKTFIVVMGEFGRTGGDLTVNKGRDHNRMAGTALFAGAGVKGGRAFGVTDEQGNKIIKPEWNEPRSIYTEDVVATMYSQLGIDWTKKITNTPSGRAFEYVEGISATNFINISEISTLFG